METMTANQAKQNFGELLDKAQRGPVAITRHGRRVAVFLSGDDYEQDQAQKQEFLERRLALSQQDIADGNIIDGQEFLNSLRAKYK